jgi:hypothetical protein
MLKWTYMIVEPLQSVRYCAVEEHLDRLGDTSIHHAASFDENTDTFGVDSV